VPLGHDELLREMDGAGVARCVLVPPTWEADRNDTSLEAARLHPDRFRVMGRLALQKAESRALLATWKSQPYMLGIRMAFNAGRTRQWLEDGTADEARISLRHGTSASVIKVDWLTGRIRHDD